MEKLLASGFTKFGIFLYDTYATLIICATTIYYLSNRMLKLEKIYNTNLIFGYYLDALNETYNVDPGNLKHPVI